MAIIYRHQKGSPLTAQEVDNNFYEIVSRLEVLEQKTTQGESIAKIEQKGDRLEIIGTYGHLLGQATLPTLQYNVRGKWLPKADYAAQDVVTREAQTWVCREAHTTAEIFDAKFWSLLLDASQALSPTSRTEIPIFMKETLPNPDLGQIALFAMEKNITLIYADGKNWRFVQDQKALEAMKKEQSNVG